MIPLKLLRSLMLILLLGCSMQEDNSPTMVDDDHTHYHVHGAEIAHDHDHELTQSTAHTHAHLHQRNTEDEPQINETPVADTENHER
ncbi:hypothetical protein [Bythopirellula polymerisocia]|uniref:Secreted protein n=1 Tax=Bythopirellula polymerisocia TaxID=2528003 RepID=A0A5C6D1A0_9BACT|nr:hypothetical protein [Bythopirellula polymerisocia]TWU29437.1 hypothetical protein Pla144_02150 [Bythopirellula polymerisocia]